MEKNNNFVADSGNKYLDQHWIFFIYYITGGGCKFLNSHNPNSNFNFLELYDKENSSKGAASACVTSAYVKAINAKIIRITAPLLWDSDVTGKSLTRGATRVMVRKVSMQAVVAKVGHDMRGSREPSVWEYMDGDDLFLEDGTSALAGWVNPYNHVYPPTLEGIIDIENTGKFNSLCSLLFDHELAMTKLQNIKGLINTMLATFLMYLKQFMEDSSTVYDKESENPNIIFDLFLKNIEDLFAVEECLEIGRTIRIEWDGRKNLGHSNIDIDMKADMHKMERVEAEARAESAA